MNSLNLDFNVIGLSETRILSSNLLNTPSLNGYQSYFTPTEALHGGTALFLSDQLNCHRRCDLETQMYSPKLLESTFAELVFKNKPNFVVGAIYRHHVLTPIEFSNSFLLPLLEKLNKQGKLLILLGDFNLNLLNHNIENNVASFIDILENYLMLPYISLPTRITDSSQTLIDNIFISPHPFKSFSGNFVTGISDHLAQFVGRKNLKGRKQYVSLNGKKI